MTMPIKPGKRDRGGYPQFYQLIIHRLFNIYPIGYPQHFVFYLNISHDIVPLEFDQ